MILLPGSILGSVISVIAFKVLVIDVGGSAGSVHVGRVEDDAVDGGVLIWIVLDRGVCWRRQTRCLAHLNARVGVAVLRI